MNHALELRRIILTLNSVEVKGRDNMDRLLGSMIRLDQVANDLEQQQEAAQPVAQEAAPGNK